VVLLLFWFAACHVHNENDALFVAMSVAGTSLILSFWVIWNAAQLNFEGYRGGITVDQNYVSIFVFPGTLVLATFLFVFKRSVWKLACGVLLLATLVASLLLASRGMFVAFFCAAIALLATTVKSKGRVLIGVIAGMALVSALILMLPGTRVLLDRFRESDLNTLDLRTLIWLHSLRHFADSGLPRMMFGQGLASDRVIAGPINHILPNYHNDYLKWLMDRGVVGLVAFIFFLHEVAQGVRKSSHPMKPLMWGWLVFFLVAALTGVLTDLQMFWILLGIIAASCPLSGPATP
jgi:O-antigen ligase